MKKILSTPKKGKNKVLKVCILALVAVSALSVGGFYLYKYVVSTMGIGKKTKDSSALYIGTYITCADSYGTNYYDRIYVEIGSSSGVLYSNSWETSSFSLVQDPLYPGLCFVDLSSVFSDVADGNAVDVWLASDSANYIKAQSSWIGPDIFKSSVVSISDSGIWFLNVPSVDGGDVQILHSFVYTKSVWSLGA